MHALQVRQVKVDHGICEGATRNKWYALASAKVVGKSGGEGKRKEEERILSPASECFFLYNVSKIDLKWLITFIWNIHLLLMKLLLFERILINFFVTWQQNNEGFRKIKTTFGIYMKIQPF